MALFAAVPAAASTSSSCATRISTARAGVAGRKSWRIRATMAASTMIDSHLVLGLDQTASKQDIKRAYRSLALQYHPDVCKGSGKEHLFTQINIAYESLMNEFCEAASLPSCDISQEHQCPEEWLSEGYTFEDIFGVEQLFDRNSERSNKVKKSCAREDW